MIPRRLRELTKSGSVKGLLQVTVGTLAAQGIALVTTIAIARLYTPADVGIFTFIASMVALLAPIATLSLPTAIVPAKTVGDAYGLARLSLTVAGAFGVICGLATVVWAEVLGEDFGLKNPNYLYFVAPAVTLLAVYSVFGQTTLRAREYRAVAARGSVQNAAIGLLQFGLAPVFHNATGLLLGDIVGRSIGAAILVPGFRLLREQSAGAWTSVRGLSVKYRGVVLHYFPAILLETASTQIMVILIGAWFGEVILGYFGLTMRVLYAPIMLVGLALGQVLVAEVSDGLRAGRADLRGPLRRLLLALTSIALGVSVVLLLFGPWLFALIFGEEWSASGELSRVIAVPLCVGIVWNPLSQMLVAYESWKPFLWISFARLTLVTLSGSAAHAAGLSYVAVILAMSVATACAQVGGILVVRRVTINTAEGQPTVAKQAHTPTPFQE